MSERWTPEINERFWYITSSLNAYYTTNNDASVDWCKISAGNCFKTEAEAKAAAKKVQALLLSLHCDETSQDKQLPDWCKHNALCYDGKEYLRIFMDGNNSICAYPVGGGTVKAYEISEITEARLRPYNADEMKALVGKVIAEKYHGGLLLATAYNSGEDCDGKPAVALLNEWTDSDDLLNGGYTIDGNPAGVLEHRANGEWVQ